MESGPIRAGGTIGRFFLLMPVGSGAMGAVWAAYDPQLDRKIALKIVHTRARGASAAAVLARSLREAQAIAKVNHPNVVAVHDVGTDGDVLYIAEELIQGHHVDDWLKRRARSVHEIVDVFVQAGRGLAAAHAAGIVHRDFKPTNVLVGNDGRARVVDFGIARVFTEPDPVAPASRLIPATSPEARLTQTGAVFGTPNYMSPEQHQGLPTEARSDQFSYCVSLYEALYGVRPFAGAGLKAIGDAVLSGAVRPPPGGARVPRWMRDVVLKGLRPRPEDRFRSMNDLLAALERDKSPLRRARGVVAFAVLGTALAAAATFYVVGQRAPLCRGAAGRLSGVWDDARRAAVRDALSKQGSPFTTTFQRVAESLDAYAHAWTSMHTEACEATRLRGEQSDEVLDLRMTCLSQRLSELKATVDVLSSPSASVVENASQIAGGLAPLSDCADIAALKTTVRLPNDPMTRSKVADVGAMLASARALNRAGRYSASLDSAKAALDVARTIGYEPLEAEALAEVGRAEMAERQDEPAARSLEDAFFVAEACRDGGTALDVSTLLALHKGKNMARRAEGHRWIRITQALLTRRGRDPEREGRLEASWGAVLEAEGRYEEALAHLRKALAVDEAASAPNDLLAFDRQRIATALLRLGQFEESLAEYQHVLQMTEKELGPEHPRVADLHADIAIVLDEEGLLDRALVEARSAAASLERTLGRDHPTTAHAHNEIGNVLADLGRYPEALGEYRITLAAEEKSLGPTHPTVGATHLNLGATMDDEGKFDDALAEYRIALAIEGNALGPDHPDVARVHEDIGDVLRKQGKFAEALPELETALRVREATLGRNHPHTATTMGHLGETHLGLHQYAQAVDYLGPAIAVAGAREGTLEEASELRFALARALWGLPDKRDQALVVAKEARAGYAKLPKLHADRDAVSRWIEAHRANAPSP